MKTILILEDNAREMERLVKIVREQGTQNEVICAVNLEQAYHMAMEKSIDLFLLDIILDPPDLWGRFRYEICRSYP